MLGLSAKTMQRQISVNSCWNDNCHMRWDVTDVSPLFTMQRGGGRDLLSPDLAAGSDFSLDDGWNIHHNVVKMIGEFEYLILTSAARLGEDAYGASIRSEIESATGRHCSIGALYTTLDRLEGKGYLKTWMGDPTPQRGGRSKRLVRITASGTKAATDFFAAVSRISQGVSWAVDRPTTR